MTPCYGGLGTPGSAFDQSNRYERRGLHASRLTLGLGCWNPFTLGEPACVEDPATSLGSHVFAAKLTLRDDSPPNLESDPVVGTTARGVVARERSRLRIRARVSRRHRWWSMAWRPIGNRSKNCRCRVTRRLLIPRRVLRAAISRCRSTRAPSLTASHVVQVAVFDAAGNRGVVATGIGARRERESRVVSRAWPERQWRDAVRTSARLVRGAVAKDGTHAGLWRHDIGRSGN